MEEIPQKPKAPLNAYFRFKKEESIKLQKENPDITYQEQNNIINQRYKQLSQQQKDQYKEDYKKDMIKYKVILQEYKNKYGDKILKQQQQKNQKKKKRQNKKLMQEELQKLQLPDKPKRPLSSFFLFKKEKENEIRKENPQLSNIQLKKKMSELYKQLSKKKLEQLQKKFEKLKKIYDKQIEEYRLKNSNLLEKEKEIKKKYRKNKDKENQTGNEFIINDESDCQITNVKLNQTSRNKKIKKNKNFKSGSKTQCNNQLQIKWINRQK